MFYAPFNYFNYPQIDGCMTVDESQQSEMLSSYTVNSVKLISTLP